MSGPAARGIGEPRRHPAVHRRDRQVGADPAARVAARRDGRPDAGVRADPRGDDGHRRRLSGRAACPASTCTRRRRSQVVAVDRRGDRVLRRDDRRRADRHQEGARVLDDLAARLHVRRAGRRRLRRRDLPPLHARVLQGLPVPRRRQRDPRARAASRTSARWAASRGRSRSRSSTFAVATAAIAGIPPLAGFFSKDEILWFAFASSRGGSPLLWAVAAATALHDGVLHVPAAVAHVLRRARAWSAEGRAPRARVAAVDDRRADRARGALGGRRLPRRCRTSSSRCCRCRQCAGRCTTSRRRSSSSRSRSRFAGLAGAAFVFGGDARARDAPARSASPRCTGCSPASTSSTSSTTALLGAAAVLDFGPRLPAPRRPAAPRRHAERPRRARRSAPPARSAACRPATCTSTRCSCSSGIDRVASPGASRHG